MLRFRPDIKPPMWGPPSAVQYAVTENAHRLLNAEPIACLSLWERGFRTQVFDVFGNVVSASSTAHTWDEYGYYTGSNIAGSGVLISLSIGVPNTAFSVFCAVRRLAHVNYKDHISVGSGTTWKASVSMPGTSGNHISYGNGTGYAGNTTEISSGDDFTAALVLNRANSTRKMYVDGAAVSVSYTPAAENFDRVRLHNRIGDDSRQVNSSLKIAYVFASVLSDDACNRLNYEPYTLLMPVARPVYFDLGATTGTDELTASNLTISAPVLGTPALGQTHALTATGITVEGPVLGAPTLAQIHALVASGLTIEGPELGTPSVGQVHSLTATGLSVSAPVLGTPTLVESGTPVDALTASDLAVGSPVLGTPSLGQVHVLGTDGLVTGAPVLGQPSITQIHALAALGLAVDAPVLGTPEISLLDGLIASDIVVGSPELGTPAIKQIHALTAVNLAVASPVFASPELEQIHALTAIGLTVSAPVLGAPVLAIDFLSNARISLPSSVWLRIILASRVRTSINLSISTGMNLDME